MAHRSLASIGSFDAPPAASSFTALNSATLSDVTTWFGPGVTVNCPNAGGTATANMKGGHLAMNYTSGTITLTAAILARMQSINYNFAGLYFRESATGKITLFNYTAQTGIIPKLNVSKWPSATGGGAGDYFDISVLMPPIPMFRMTYDGTNMKFYGTADFTTWQLIQTVAKADYFTTAPDQWGFFGNSQNATYDSDVTLISWLVS